MKILIISDSHGHIANLKTIVEIAKKGRVDGIIHAGDWNTPESVNIILSSGIPLYTVLGNADIDSEIDKILRKGSEKYQEDFLLINLDDRRVGITHKPSNNKNFFQYKNHLAGQNLDLIVNGHLHSRYESVETPVKIIRPGALVNGINFVVFDTKNSTLEFINE